jgi:hypothetical protein
MMLCKLKRLGQAVFGLGLTVLIGSASAHGATVSAGDDAGLYGQRLQIPLTLAKASGESVAGLQVDILFDDGLLYFIGIETGNVVVAADKDVNYSVMAPGHIRAVIAGFNQNEIADGVLLTLMLDVFPTTQDFAASSIIALENLIIADPNGEAVPANAVAGTLTLDFTNLPTAEAKHIFGLAVLCIAVGMRRTRYKDPAYDLRI